MAAPSPRRDPAREIALQRYIRDLERQLDDERRPSIVPAFAVAAAFGVATGLSFAGAELLMQWLGWIS